jgi:curved DNA-binding protein CbpA
MLPRMETMQTGDGNFRARMVQFINDFHDSNDNAKIKSEYVKLVKEFHPDVNRDIDDKLANEYMVIINYIYEGLINKQKITLESDGEYEKSRVNGKYCFINEEGKKEYVSEKAVFIYKLGKREYDRAVIKSMQPMGRDPKNEGYEINGHLYRSYRYFQEVIKTDKGGIWGRAAEDSLNKAYEMSRRITRGLCESDEKELLWTGS